MPALPEGEGAVEAKIESVEAVVELRIRTDLREHDVSGGTGCSFIHTAGSIRSRDEGIQFSNVMELPSARVALHIRYALASIGQEDVHRHARGDGPDRRELEFPGQIRHSVKNEVMPLIVGRRTVFALEIVGVDRRIVEWDLIVVGVVVGLRPGVRGVEFAVLRETLAGAEPEAVVRRVNGRLEIGDAVGAASDGVEDGTYRSPDDEARAEVVNAVNLEDEALANLLFDAEVELLDHGVAQTVVDDIDAG